MSTVSLVFVPFPSVSTAPDVPNPDHVSISWSKVATREVTNDVSGPGGPGESFSGPGGPGGRNRVFGHASTARFWLRFRAYQKAAVREDPASFREGFREEQ